MDFERPSFVEGEPERERPSADCLNLAELLERSDLDDEPAIKKLLQDFISDYPPLAEVGVGFITPNDEAETGGYFEVVQMDEQTALPMVFLMRGEHKQMEHLLTSRRQSVEMCAEKLGVEPERMTPELLGEFIMSHELGHAVDFMKNYFRHHDNAVVAAEEWYLHYDSNLMGLPVRGLDPAELRMALAGVADLSVAAKKVPQIAKLLERESYDSLEDLMTAQEIAYRNMPYEQFADDIAADFLKKHGLSLE